MEVMSSLVMAETLGNIKKVAGLQGCSSSWCGGRSKSGLWDVFTTTVVPDTLTLDQAWEKQNLG